MSKEAENRHIAPTSLREWAFIMARGFLERLRIDRGANPSLEIDLANIFMSHAERFVDDAKASGRAKELK